MVSVRATAENAVALCLFIGKFLVFQVIRLTGRMSELFCFFLLTFNIIYAILNIVKINKKGMIDIELDKIPEWLLALEPEDVTFLKNFVLKSGSLKEIARLYEVSYPTVRLRLDKLIQKIELNDKKEEEPFSTFIKGLAVDSRIDLETAKLILEKYKQEKGE